MREILFRGKNCVTNNWVYGNYCAAEYLNSNGVEHLIVEVPRNGVSVRIIPETVGQYTGLLDKDGKKVFEGDIVKVYDNFDYVGETLYVGTVQWDDTFLNWELKTSENIVWSLKNLPSVLYYEVIGNVFDNPELLEVK